MKNIKTKIFVFLLMLSVYSFSATAIIYVGADGSVHGCVIMNDVDCEALMQDPDVLHCEHFGVDPGNGQGDENIEVISALEKATFTIETDGNNITYVDKITNESFLLMSVSELNISENYYIDISGNKENIYVMVTPGSEFTKTQERSFNNQTYSKTFSIPNSSTNKITDNTLIYPNPASNDVNLIIPISVVSNFDNLQVKLFDINGKEVREISQVTNSKVLIRRNGLHNGSYIYKVLNNNEVIEQGKIIFK